jgi:hypothetical protein
MKFHAVFSIGLLLACAFPARFPAQTAETVDLSHNVLAGGGAPSTGGDFRVEGSVGQALAGTLSAGAQFRLHGGFWFPPPLAPTAATVSVSGRVINLRGGSVRRVRVVLTEAATGATRAAQTNPFGFFRFENVEVGRVYTVQAQSRNFHFTPDAHVFSLLEARDDLEFTAVPVE